MKRLFTALALFFCATTMVLAQRTITGTITDDTGEPLIGANVLVKGTTVGTVTDFDGTYSLSVPDDASTLVVSYTGYSTQELPITGNVADVVLSEGVALGEVVVTGLGIKKEKKALGYGVSTLKADAIANQGEVDVSRILNGKATGVNITQTSGLAGSGTNIIIRGYSSITGSNQPLFVVDGVPFNTSTNNDGGFTSGSATASSRFLDLDPNNIEEISILKGLSATVLYGEAGRNGVVLVTTKSGGGASDAQKGMEVSISQGFNWSEISNLPKYQNTYGNGFSGNFGWFFSNWGPSFDIKGSNGIDENGQIPHPMDQSQYNADFPQLKGVKYDYKPYTSVEDFFDTGFGYNTSISIDKKFQDASLSTTYSYTDDKGFTPNFGQMVETTDAQGRPYWNYDASGDASNFYRKHNLGIGGTANLLNGLRVSGSLNVIKSERKNPPAATSYGSGTGGGSGFISLFADVLYTPRSIDLNHLPYESPIDKRNVYYRRGSPITNPYWTLNNATQDETIDRFFGNVQLMYDFTDWLSATYRVGIDQYTQDNAFSVNKGGPNIPQGLYTLSNRNNRVYDHTLNFLYDYNVSDDWNLNGIVGVNLRGEQNRYKAEFNSEQFVYGLFTSQNFITQTASSYYTNEITNGLFGTVTLGYKNYLYLGFQARNDWTSTLPKDNRSVFYPSGNISFVPTDAFNLANTPIDYLKLRLGYGVSAGYPDPYETSTVLYAGPRQFITADGVLTSINSNYNRQFGGAFLGNPNLQAEKVGELEFGIESRLWDNRIGIDFSWYDKKSTDLLINLPLDPATGYTSTSVNGAKVTNTGIELGLNLNPVRGDFNWDMTWNYTKNKNVVDEIIEGVDQVRIAGFSNEGNFAIPGQNYGVIQGTAYVKNDEGKYLVNGLGEYVESSDIEIIGDPNPNYTLNWLNTLAYKGFALNWQFAYQDGGDIYSTTTATMLARGNTVDSDFDRFFPLVMPGVLASDETTPNNIQVYAGDAFFSAYFGANEGSIFDATNIRLREVALSYALPRKIFTNSFLGGLSFKAYGNNLWYNSVNFPEGVNFDPEVLSLGVGNGRGFDYITGPTSRRYGLVVNLTF